MRRRFSSIAIGTLVVGAVFLASFSVAAPPPIAPTPLTQVPGLPILKIPFHFASLWVYDPSTLQAQAMAQANKAVWPIAYDLRPIGGIHLMWVPDDFPQEKIPDLVAGKGGYSLGLVLNGKVLERGPDGWSGEYNAYFVQPGAPALYGCPPGKWCLGTTIHPKTWYSWWSKWPPWYLELRVARPEPMRPPKPQKPQLPIFKPCPDDPFKLCPQPPPGPEPVKVKATVVQKPAGSYFAEKLYPTFQHPRCRTCHYVGTPAGLINEHAAIGGAKVVGVTLVSKKHPVTGAAPGHASDLRWRLPRTGGCCGDRTTDAPVHPWENV